MTPITIETLASAAPGSTVLGDAATPVADLAYDSRAVRDGTLFFCVPGARADGHDFAGAAVAAGAHGLVVQRALDQRVPQIVVPSVRAAMGPIGAEFYGKPSRALALIGVTGTNGKTTTTFMLESVFRAMGITPGVIGTVETRIGHDVLPVTRTTPEAIDVHGLLARMRDAGVDGVAMEVSSHGLEQHRVGGAWFACAAFTNLTQDHLDYHGTMEAYFQAKSLLFRPELSERAAINVGDPYGARLAGATALPVTTFAMDGDADVVVESIELDRAGSTARVHVNGEPLRLRVSIPARHNVANALCVLAIARAMEWPLDVVAEGIESLRGVPGRLEPVEAGQDFTVLVDYAHTPDSLQRVLVAARELVRDGAGLVVVFGCGGDRDRGKRPLMGRAGAALADRCVITSDNPRSEDPAAIVAEIEAGARETGRPYEAIVDRRHAIASALRAAGAGDVVLIAGKGHETGQEFADRTLPFDDRIVAREILESR